MKKIKNKRVLVTGSCGTIGAELVRYLISDKTFEPLKVICMDNDESKIFFQANDYKQNEKIECIVGDIRDINTLNTIMDGVDIVFHLAALKHVYLYEKNPDQAVLTNILGVQNIIKAAKNNNVEKVIFTSSDKAVNPTNVMGTSKLMGERLITAANVSSPNSKTIFASTRFGNVLGSNGSVVPIFKQQIKNNQKITLTDKRMSRFIMDVRTAVELVIDSAIYARGGEVFVTKMPVIKIEDLAIAMIELLGHMDNSESLRRIEEIGVKAGEKLYEELMSDEETSRAIELKEFFCILPAFKDQYSHIKYTYNNLIDMSVSNAYISRDEKSLSIREIKDYLITHKLV